MPELGLKSESTLEEPTQGRTQLHTESSSSLELELVQVTLPVLSFPRQTTVQMFLSAEMTSNQVSKRQNVTENQGSIGTETVLPGTMAEAKRELWEFSRLSSILNSH